MECIVVHYSHQLNSMEFSDLNVFPYNFCELDRLIINAFVFVNSKVSHLSTEN